MLFHCKWKFLIFSKFSILVSCLLSKIDKSNFVFNYIFISLLQTLKKFRFRIKITINEILNCFFTSSTFIWSNLSLDKIFNSWIWFNSVFTTSRLMVLMSIYFGKYNAFGFHFCSSFSIMGCKFLAMSTPWRIKFNHNIFKFLYGIFDILIS